MAKKKEVNIGHLSMSKLKKETWQLIRVKICQKEHKWQGRYYKANDYKHLPDAPRKRCHTCGNQTHLVIDYKLNSPKAQSPKASESKVLQTYESPLQTW